MLPEGTYKDVNKRKCRRQEA